MSETELDRATPSGRRVWPWAVAGLVVVLGALYLFTKPKPRPIIPPPQGVAEDSLGQARQALARETDVRTCRDALQQINNQVAVSPGLTANLRPLPREDFKKLLDLDDSELAEIDGSSYTLLDGRHLEQCFLLRDAGQALQMTGPFTALDRATAGFRWAMRQVRLEEHGYPTAPPVYALRRGWGTPLERSLVFLELLRQLGSAGELHGCLVYCPDKDGSQRLWACGVILEGKPAIHLFDPRLGLPLPGPDGKGVATLGQVCKTPSVLTQLTVSDKHPYDVTPEQAGKAELRQVCLISALAPRMHLLQTELLGPNINVRLALDPQAERQQLAKAAASELGQEDAVRSWQEITPRGTANGAGFLRRFLSAEEGGSDRPQPGQPGRELLYYQSVYQPIWAKIPPPLNDPSTFPPNSELGGRARAILIAPFAEAMNNPEKPRTLILRGRFSKAAPKLVEEQGSIRGLLQQPPDADKLRKELIEEWLPMMFKLYAEQGHAKKNPAQLEAINQQIEEGWQPQNARALFLLIVAGTARSRSAYLGYQLGLCKHDQAEVQQARIELQARSGTAPSDADARNAWEDALGAWDRFLEDHPKDPASGAARQLRARALEKMGRLQEAITAWEDVSPPLGPLEKVAGLYQARELHGRK